MPELEGAAPPAGEGTPPVSPAQPGSGHSTLTDTGPNAAPDVATVVADRRYWPTYLLGLALQVFLWFLLFWFLAVAIGAGNHLTEFRYVGF
jgi:hypothetical protein